MSYTDSSHATPDPSVPHPDATAKPGYDPEIAARVRAERQANRDAKRKSLVEFVPQSSVAVIDTTIVLHSSVVQKNFSLWYSYAQSACFMLRDVLSGMTTRENQEQADEVVNSHINKTRKDMDNELARLKVLADDVGLRQERKFTAPRTQVVPAYTPEAIDFLHLIRVYDEILWYAEALQILRGISNSEKITLRSRYKTKLTGLVRQIAQIWVRAKAAARREREASAEAEAKRYSAREAERATSSTVAEGVEVVALDAAPAEAA